MLLFTVVIIAFLAVSSIAWFTTRSVLQTDAFNQITSVREVRKDEIERYFKTLRSELQLLSQDENIIDAMQTLHAGFIELENVVISAEQETNLNNFYDSEFLQKLEANMRRDLSIEDYRPQGNVAAYLQYHYLANNPNPTGEKHLLDQADDDSSYSNAHARYHPLLRTFLDLFQYYDLFLIDPETRTIVYSVFKEVDYASNLIDGPYATSGLGEAVDRILENPDPARIDVVDFRAYDPSAQAPAMFLGMSLYAGETLIGVLVIQAPVDEIDQVMTSGQAWEEKGLGVSGETYLVGADHLMRSMSRFLIEDKLGYLQALRNADTNQEQIDLIANLETSILQQEVNTASVELALAGQDGVHIVNDYRGVAVLSAYAPVEIEGFDWVILAEIDEAEVSQPIIKQQRFFLMSAGGFAVVLSILSYVAVNLLMRPIGRLVDRQKRVREGDFETLVPTNSADEVGILTSSFNQMVESLHAQRSELKKQIGANDRLMLSILPDSIVTRVKQGEKNIAEPVGQVTLLFARLRGLYAMETRFEDDKHIAQLLNLLSNELNRAADTVGVVRQPAVSNRYTFTCGLDDAAPDHTERTIKLALMMRKLLKTFNEQHGTQLAAQIGIHTGRVLATVSETRKLHFDLWGTTVAITDSIVSMAASDELLVSHEVYQKLRLAYDFEQHEPVLLENGTIWRVWRFVPSIEDDISAELATENLNQILAQTGTALTLPASIKPRRRRLWRRFVQK
ncbi:MAG: adenylate/guanylate cyclase domain-containing protein [Candidatus Promineifilaceae bacterium]